MEGLRKRIPERVPLAGNEEDKRRTGEEAVEECGSPDACSSHDVH